MKYSQTLTVLNDQGLKEEAQALKSRVSTLTGELATERKRLKLVELERFRRRNKARIDTLIEHFTSTPERREELAAFRESTWVNADYLPHYGVRPEVARAWIAFSEKGRYKLTPREVKVRACVLGAV